MPPRGSAARPNAAEGRRGNRTGVRAAARRRVNTSIAAVLHTISPGQPTEPSEASATATAADRHFLAFGCLTVVSSTGRDGLLHQRQLLRLGLLLLLLLALTQAQSTEAETLLLALGRLRGGETVRAVAAGAEYTAS